MDDGVNPDYIEDSIYCLPHWLTSTVTQLPGHLGMARDYLYQVLNLICNHIRPTDLDEMVGSLRHERPAPLLRGHRLEQPTVVLLPVRLDVPQRILGMNTRLRRSINKTVPKAEDNTRRDQRAQEPRHCLDASQPDKESAISTQEQSANLPSRSPRRTRRAGRARRP